MIDIGAIVSITRDTIKELTDVVGLIEKNISSYDRIKARFRRKRIAGRLEAILLRLTYWRQMNRRTLWMLAEIATRDEDGPSSLPADIDEDFGYHGFHSDMRLFLEGLLATRDLIDEFKKDIVSVDYRLYEDLHDAVNGRIELVEMFMDGGKVEGKYAISTEKLKRAYSSYRALVDSVSAVKDAVQSGARSVLQAGKSTRRATSKIGRSKVPNRKTD
jgi:hypothetical protein